MSYEPTNWKSGDTVTSAKLNKMEQGIANAGGVFVVGFGEGDALDKTWQEIADAAKIGLVLLIDVTEEQTYVAYLKETMASDDEYQVAFGENYYIASSADGYPVSQ